MEELSLIHIQMCIRDRQGYDYIGVNIYPNTHSDSYVKELKNTVEEDVYKRQVRQRLGK